MNITMTGATGFIGRRLVDRLLARNHSIHILSRNVTWAVPDVRVSQWDPMTAEPPLESLQHADAVVHLAGEPVAQRWTPETKSRIRESRWRGTRHLVHALSTLSKRPSVLVSSSAVGIYGYRGDEVLTEASQPGEGFLAEVCIEWEKQASLAESLGMRAVKIRTGIVLGTTGGALAKMLPTFRMCVGGRLGSGKQWMSWIHLDDLVSLIHYAIENPIQGPVNGTAPTPVTNAEFTKKLGTVLHRPTVFPVPALAVRTAFGEMGEILLGSQRAIPQAAQSAGFRFEYPELTPALQNLLG